jgi:hypothetical protein
MFGQASAVSTGSVRNKRSNGKKQRDYDTGTGISVQFLHAVQRGPSVLSIEPN